MKAKLLVDISDNWKAGTEVYQFGHYFCKIDGGCLEAGLIYESDYWELTEDDDNTQPGISDC